MKEAEAELLSRGTPQGKLPHRSASLGTLFMPKLGDFKRRYPEIDGDDPG
ncbi:hypothetical protein M8494_17190 [Serratia ureilytica]